VVRVIALQRSIFAALSRTYDVLVIIRTVAVCGMAIKRGAGRIFIKSKSFVLHRSSASFFHSCSFLRCPETGVSSRRRASSCSWAARNPYCSLKMDRVRSSTGTLSPTQSVSQYVQVHTGATSATAKILLLRIFQTKTILPSIQVKVPLSKVYSLTESHGLRRSIPVRYEY
jgi:hypothetical protein